MMFDIVTDERGRKFELCNEVGVDSAKTSRVFHAENIRTCEPVCIKMADRMFDSEYQNLEMLLAIYDGLKVPEPFSQGRITHDGESRHYISKEFIIGEDLLNYYKRKWFVSDHEKFSTIIGDLICMSEILEKVHDLQRYHGDLKPSDFVKECDFSDSNSEDGRIYLVDIEMLIAEGAAPMCWLAECIYIPLEIKLPLSRDAPDRRSDIYSLGQIAYTLCVAADGRAYRRFLVDSSSSSKHEINDTFDIGIPTGLFSVIDKATEHTMDKRYDSVQAFKEDLRKI